MYDAADCEMRIVMGQGSDNASVGKQFLKVTPKDATTLTPDEFQHAVKRVLGKDTYGSDEVCALCKLAGGNSVGHLVKCKKVSGTTRHDTMVDIIADALKLINPVRTETLTAPRENKRRMDIRMDHNGKIIWCDVSITSEFQQSRMDEAARKRPKPHMKALDKRHKEKLSKYQEDADMKQRMGLRKITMEPLIFTCGGAVHTQTWKFLSKMSNTAEKRGYNHWLFDLVTDLSLALHRTSYAMECEATHRRRNLKAFSNRPLT